MKIDRTTKLLLAVIALALAAIAIRPQPIVPVASAQETTTPAAVKMKCTGRLNPRTTGAQQGHGGNSSTIVVPGYDIEVTCEPGS